MKEQKFHKGDLVQIAKDLGPHMSHFQADCQAIVIGSYKDQFGGNDVESYTLFFKGSGEASWYEEDQLTLVESNRADLIEQWEREIKEERELKSNLEWIFNQDNNFIDKPHSASVERLGKDLGVDDLWGSHGEGIVYYANSMSVHALAKPFVKAGDIEGWKNFCETLKKRKEDSLK